MWAPSAFIRSGAPARHGCAHRDLVTGRWRMMTKNSRRLKCGLGARRPVRVSACGGGARIQFPALVNAQTSTPATAWRHHHTPKITHAPRGVDRPRRLGAPNPDGRLLALSPPGARQDSGMQNDIRNALDDHSHPVAPRMSLKCAYYLTDCSDVGCGNTWIGARRPGLGCRRSDLARPAARRASASLVETRVPLRRPATGGAGAQPPDAGSAAIAGRGPGEGEHCPLVIAAVARRRDAVLTEPVQGATLFEPGHAGPNGQPPGAIPVQVPPASLFAPETVWPSTARRRPQACGRPAPAERPGGWCVAGPGELLHDIRPPPLARLGLGRIVASYNRSSTLYQIQ
jgi:hypothetical protein